MSPKPSLGPGWRLPTVLCCLAQALTGGPSPRFRAPQCHRQYWQGHWHRKLHAEGVLLVKEAETKTEGVAQIPGHLSIHVEQLPATPKAPKDPLSRFGGAFGVTKKASPTAMRVKHCSCSRAKRAD